jgi:kynurenine formamidase
MRRAACLGVLAGLALLPMSSRVAASLAAPPAPVVPEKIVDLTHAFGPDTIYWPTAGGFELQQLAHGRTDKGFFYAANRFCSAEHGGTHLDAPIHFFEGRRSADEIPVEQLVGAGVRVDVTARCAQDRDHRITVADLVAFEIRNGRIPPGTIVLLQTGWAARWSDRAAYLGTSRTGPDAVADLHFPGLHPDAARFLARERNVKAVGIDTASIDHGPSTLFESHVVLTEANVPVFENVASLDALPEKGFVVAALPMKIKGGSGGPLRIVAWW